MNDSTNTPLMQDFIFGALEADENTLAAERRRWSGIRHLFDIDPLDPEPDQPVKLRVTVGRDVLIDHLTAYVTIGASFRDNFGPKVGQDSNVMPKWDICSVQYSANTGFYRILFGRIEDLINFRRF